MSLEHILQAYGYYGLLFGTFLEGETILIIAGFAAHRGYFHLPYVIFAAFLGTFLGDQLYFFIGRVKGKTFLEKRKKWRPRIERARRLLEKYQTPLILVFRFIYGIRTVTPFVIGMSDIKIGRYLALNLISAFVWAAVIAVCGYFLGSILAVFLDGLKKFEIFIIFAIAVFGILVWIFYLLKEKSKNLKYKNNINKN